MERVEREFDVNMNAIDLREEALVAAYSKPELVIEALRDEGFDIVHGQE
jgi:hypothetical protein